MRTLENKHNSNNSKSYQLKIISRIKANTQISFPRVRTSILGIPTPIVIAISTNQIGPLRNLLMLKKDRWKRKGS